MKARYFHLPKTKDSSFVVQHDLLPDFYGILHHHPEAQLTLILKGKGHAIIGDQYFRFEPNTLILIGASVPHVFKNEDVNEGVETLSIYYHPAQIGEGVQAFEELKYLSKIAELASRSYEIKGLTRVWVSTEMVRIEALSGLARFTVFLDILGRILASGELLPLSDFTLTSFHSDADTERLDKVFGFVLDHYAETIHLEKVAGLAFMTPNAFCRYFKTRTRKTFFTFLLDIRIGKAMQLLRETKKGIADVARESGFNNLSHFNREFKKRAGCSPKEYRNP